MAFEEDDDEDGFDEDGSEAVAAMQSEAMGVTEEGVVMFDTGAEGGLADETLQMESASEVV